MKKENVVTARVGDINGRITRARAAALRASVQLPPIKEASAKQDQKWGLRANKKRASLDENNINVPDNPCLQRKRREVLQDVTNVCCGNSYRSCFNATKIQVQMLSSYCVHKVCCAVLLFLVHAAKILQHTHLTHFLAEFCFIVVNLNFVDIFIA